MTSYEVNFDGLIGPTHNYGGLSFGNIASKSNKFLASNPKKAALQGLAKMKFCMDLGLKQGILPPQSRPNLSFLKQLGFAGSHEQILREAAQVNPRLLVAGCSASSMWAANAATVSPSADTENQKVHFTSANLCSNLHRYLEVPMTSQILQTIFANPQYFQHHQPLPSIETFRDEGAANHTRFCADYGDPGVEFFVYGKHSLQPNKVEAQQFPARQTQEASASIARLHQLASDKVVFAQQSPLAIDHGAFHNDVVAVGNKNILFCHSHSYVNQQEVIQALKDKLAPTPLHCVEVNGDEVMLQDTIKSYLFNSQLISLPSGECALIAPTEVRENVTTAAYVDQLLANNSQPIRHVHYVDCRQSMRNGGGPACLRLRVVLTEEEINAINCRVLLDDNLYQQLVAWVNKHYRGEITLDDLLDPMLIEENYRALDELTQLLKLGSLYEFQQ